MTTRSSDTPGPVPTGPDAAPAASGTVVALPTAAGRAPLSGRISVITVSYRTGPALMESLRSVLADPDVSELIVVDNGNSPADRAGLASLLGTDPRLRLLQGHGNTGFARACNYGASLATGDVLLFLNPDAVIEPGAPRALLEAGRGRTHPWIAGGRLLGPDGAEQRGARRGRLTFASAFGSFTPLHRLPGIESLHWETRPLPNGPIELPTVSGAMMLMPRTTFDALGGFDDGYFLHVEDIALCRAAREAGGAVVFVPGAQAMHYGSTSNVPRMAIEWHKLRGFLRYFWTGGGALSRIGTVFGAPLMGAAIMGRASWLSLREAFTGR